MEIRHFGHEAHPLKHMEDIDRHVSFACCPNWYPGQPDDRVEGYGCKDCKYFIHKSCSEIPNEINHFYHPNHILKLGQQQSDRLATICAACLGMYATFTYRCTECPDFEMDVPCVMLSFTTNRETAETLHYPHHGHPLTLCDGGSECCDLCLKRCLGPTYRCNSCKFFIHQSCADINLPQEIYHQDHPLRLATNYEEYKDDLDYSISCEICESTVRYLKFRCLKCCCYMDFGCALLPTIIKQKAGNDKYSYIEHFSHYHPLKLCDDYKTEEIQCSFCKKHPSAGPGPCYECDYCSFYLHEACSHQLAQRIETHPFHPSHALTLRVSLKNFTCYACRRTFSESFGYKCSESCNIILDLECASRKPSVKFESHHHLLTLFKSIDTDTLICNVCHEKCEKNILRCVECNYNLHVLCGPLPCTIEDKCRHLELVDRFVDDYDEEGIFYCDNCEQPRDPDECVYVCKDENFVTEIKLCPRYVLCSLEGVRGNTLLRTTTTKTKGWMIISGRVISDVESNFEKETDNIQVNYSDNEELDGFYKGLKDFFTIEERDQVCKILNAAGVSTDALQSVLRSNSISKSSRFKSVDFGDPDYRVLNEASPYTDEAFTDLMDRLDLSRGMREMLVVFDKYQQVVKIGDLVIFKELAPCLKGLLQEYDDFTAKSNLGSRVKMFFLTIFCGVVREMCITGVGEINEHLLNKWWKYLKAVQHAEFEIEFAMDRLYKITQTFFGLHARASIKAKESKFDELTIEVKEIEDKLEAKRLQLEALKLEIVGRKNALKYPSSPLIKECDNLIAEFQYRKAWDGSPIMFQNFTSL